MLGHRAVIDVDGLYDTLYKCLNLAAKKTRQRFRNSFVLFTRQLRPPELHFEP